MKKQKEFFIGWQNELPPTSRSVLKKLVLTSFILIPIIAFVLVFFQRPINAYQFEFGKLSEITGTYYHTPFPMLIADSDILPDELSKDILLVGYGKFGASGIMNLIQNEQGDLHGKKITLSGTLIYGDGKTLMELTEEHESLIHVDNQTTTRYPAATVQEKIAVSGEIIDPKCYFGVMKPGEGKIHKSCAIRCISGGIPPVFRHEVGDLEKTYEYYLILDQVGEPMNREVLPFVAEHVSVVGKTNKLMNWNVLFISPDQIQRLN